jgi:hypothetical protein
MSKQGAEMRKSEEEEAAREQGSMEAREYERKRGGRRAL